MDKMQADDGLIADQSDNIFGSDAAFADVELAALKSERDRLKAELASRTEAWRVALRELSVAQDELAALRGEIEAATPDVLNHADWENIIGEPGPTPNQGS